MAAYFFDASALAKLYHPEAGTAVVDRIVNGPDAQIRVSRLTVSGVAIGSAVRLTPHEARGNGQAGRIVLDMRHVSGYGTG